MQNRLVSAAIGGATLVALVGGTSAVAGATPAVPDARSVVVPCSVGYPPTASACRVDVVLSRDAQGRIHLDLVITDVFKPDERVVIRVFSRAYDAGTFTSDASGTLHASITLPADLPAGAHTIQAVGAGGETTSSTITVPGATAPATTTTGGNGSLPFTGGDIAAISIVGGALVVGGGAAYATGARRKRRTAAA